MVFFKLRSRRRSISMRSKATSTSARYRAPRRRRPQNAAGFKLAGPLGAVRWHLKELADAIASGSNAAGVASMPGALLVDKPQGPDLARHRRLRRLDAEDARHRQPPALDRLATGLLVLRRQHAPRCPVPGDGSEYLADIRLGARRRPTAHRARESFTLKGRSHNRTQKPRGSTRNTIGLGATRSEAETRRTPAPRSNRVAVFRFRQEIGRCQPVPRHVPQMPLPLPLAEGWRCARVEGTQERASGPKPVEVTRCTN